METLPSDKSDPKLRQSRFFPNAPDANSRAYEQTVGAPLISPPHQLAFAA